MDPLLVVVGLVSGALGWWSGVYGATRVIRAELQGLRRDVDRHEGEIRDLRTMRAG